MNLKNVKQSEHVFIAGKTGTGKTYLVRKYLQNVKRVAVLDTKGLLIWPEVDEKEITTVTSLAGLNSLSTSKVIYRPTFEEMDEEFYDRFFKWCYRQGNLTVWVDEVMSVATSHLMPEYYKAILTRGREHNVSVWSLTQRPTGIPILSMSEATHYFIFDLNMPQDRDRIVQISGQPEFALKPSIYFDKYTCWYHNVENDGVVPLKIKPVIERRRTNAR